jgi:Ca-activated chloride channel family protein
MIVFDQVWVFFLLPLPLLVGWLLKAYATQRDALRAPIFRRLVEITGKRSRRNALVLRRNLLQKLGVVIGWLCLVMGGAAPQWLGEPIVQTQPARDLMFAVDLSGSMETKDFVFNDRFNPSKPIDRLAGVKTVIKEFVSQRDNDRVGLIVFGSAPYLQIPFTLDYVLFEQLLSEAQIRMAGPKTMLGDAIGLAVKHFSSSMTKKKVLILLTDGNDSGSLVPPLEAAKVALEEGITIHTIVVGDPAATGEQELDIGTLELISAITGGVFFRAESADELTRVYSALDKLEAVSVEVTTYRPKRSLFHWFLGVAFILQLVVQLRMAIKSMRRQRVMP